MSAAISATPPVRPIGRRCRPGRRGRRRAARSICSTASMPSTAWAAISRVSRPATISCCRRAGCSASRPTSRFPAPSPASSTLSSATSGTASYAEKVEFSGTLRGRIGYAPNLGATHWLFYATGGFAWSYDQFTRTQIAGTSAGGTAMPGQVENLFLVPRVGGVAGAGVELALPPNWTARLEYLFIDYGNRSVTFPAGAQRFSSDLNAQRVALRPQLQSAQRRSEFGHAANAPPTPHFDNFAVHGQTTFLEQYVFRVPLALFRPEQPCSEPGPRDLGCHAVSRHAAVAGRRALGRSGNRPGLWLEQHARRRRFPERRGVQGRRRGALCARAARLRPPDHRSRRRHAEGRRRGQPVQRLARPPIGWCSRSASSPSPTFSTTTNMPTIRATTS